MTDLAAATPLSDDILDKAMQLFWQKGYFNTSISDLVHVTHTNRAALYKTYGGKHGLFMSMLNRYKDNITDDFFAILKTDNPGLKAIEHFFQQLTDPTMIDKFQHGCFLVNTAADLPSHHDDVSQFIYHYMDELKVLFVQNLKAAPEYNNTSDEEISQLADFLLGNVIGIFTLLRSNTKKERVTNHIKTVTKIIQLNK